MTEQLREGQKQMVARRKRLSGRACARPSNIHQSLASL